MIRNNDGSIEVVVPDGETWQSGQIRQAADGRLGVVANGPSVTGNAAGTNKQTLHCAVDLEVEIKTSIAVSPGDTPGVDIANQQLVAAGSGTKNVRLCLSTTGINGKAQRLIRCVVGEMERRLAAFVHVFVDAQAVAEEDFGIHGD